MWILLLGFTPNNSTATYAGSKEDSPIDLSKEGYASINNREIGYYPSDSSNYDYGYSKESPDYPVDLSKEGYASNNFGYLSDVSEYSKSPVDLDDVYDYFYDLTLDVLEPIRLEMEMEFQNRIPAELRAKLEDLRLEQIQNTEKLAFVYQATKRQMEWQHQIEFQVFRTYQIVYAISGVFQCILLFASASLCMFSLCTARVRAQRETEKTGETEKTEKGTEKV